MKFDQSEIDAIAEAVAAKLSHAGEPRMYDVAKAAELLSLPVRWLYERTARGEIPHCKIGKYLRFSDENLRQIVASGASGKVPEDHDKN